MKVNKYQDLIVWQKGMDFAEKVYQVTKVFSAEKKFGLTSQLNRSCVYIPSNIAEGAGRESKKEFSQFLSIAMGSCFEAETQILLAKRFEFITNEQTTPLLELSSENERMIAGLKKSLLNKITLLFLTLFSR